MHDYRQQESGNSQAGNVSFRPVADDGLVWLQLASGNRSDPIRVPFDVSEALDFRFGIFTFAHGFDYTVHRAPKLIEVRRNLGQKVRFGFIHRPHGGGPAKSAH